METIDCLVVGAGVIGLAIARALSESGRQVVVIEKGMTFGAETSSRNSEVIHAGIYYAPGSLMATLCIAGRKALYAYCEDRNIAYRRCGKLIVATEPEEIHQLDHIARHAKGNGLDDLVFLTKAETLALEPALACEGALLSPSTGIFDSHGYMLALVADVEANGGIIAYRSRLLRAMPAARNFDVHIETHDGETSALRCNVLLNAAGLQAPAVAASIAGLNRRYIPTAYFAKGSYFGTTARVPFSRLIYPVPVSGGLGVHLTLDLAGRRPATSGGEMGSRHLSGSYAKSSNRFLFCWISSRALARSRYPNRTSGSRAAVSARASRLARLSCPWTHPRPHCKGRRGLRVISSSRTTKPVIVARRNVRLTQVWKAYEDSTTNALENSV